MKLFRIKISSWTASFRYPNLISGIQPTLEVPPISTILGLMNAVAGKYILHEQLKFGYYFEYAAKSYDLETIYQITTDSKGIVSNSAKSNIVNREFLFENKLVLYFTEKEHADYFKKPYFNIVLGRSNDLATIEEIQEVELSQQINADKIKGQIIPFEQYLLPGTIQALPKYFSNEIPRNNIGTEAYSVINCKTYDFPTKIPCIRDESIGNGVDIFVHDLNFSDYE